MSRRLLIFGDSGAEKSTLAKACSERDSLAHLDLDTLAWLPGAPPKRRPLAEAGDDIRDFMAKRGAWVIEGCYADLLKFAAAQATGAIWLDLPVEACIANARTRPFEPHKYASPEAQDANLPMLINWIGAYADRDGPLSRSAHQQIFDAFSGSKWRLEDNAQSIDAF